MIIRNSKIKSFLGRHTGHTFFFWLLLHAIGRFIIEQFRDDPRGDFLLGLSPSSWISLGLITLAALQFFPIRSRAVGLG